MKKEKLFAFLIFSLMVVLGTVGCKTKTKSSVTTTKTNPTSQSETKSSSKTTKGTSSSQKPSSSSQQTTAKKTYTGLNLKSGFDQTEFFMDELDQFSLANVVFEAQYSDGTKKDINPDDLTCEAPSQMVIGENDFTVKYEEEGVEHTFVLTITLKVKTAADVEYTTMVFESGEGETTEVTVPALPEGAKLYDMLGTEIVLEENKVTLPVGETLVKMVDGEDTEYFLVKVGTLIDDLDKFKAINEHLDGYYILTSDILIEGKPQMIGSITIKASEADEEVKLPDFTDATNKPFTGTFDGNGYSLVGFTHVISSEEHWYDLTAYAYGIFGYIGETGVVKNLTIKHAHFEGGQNTAIVAGVNKGLIENIVIAESNYLYSNYERAAAISVYNYGTVRNVVSLLTKFHARDNKVLDLKLASINGEVTEVQNGFIDKLDHTQALGSEFDFYEGYGTVLKNDKFVALLDTPKATLPFGETFEVKVVNAQNVTPVFMVQVNGADDLDIDVVKDATTGKYNLVFAEGVIQPRDEITIYVASSNSLEVVDVIFVKVLAPTIVSIEPKNAITVTEGMDLDISQIKLVVTYSDGTKVEIDVAEQVGYDKTKEVGTQTVKLIYGTGETQFIEAEVTMVAKEATAIEVKKSATAKISYELGEQLVLDGFTLVVKYNNNTESEPIALTADMIDNTSYHMDTVADYNVKVTYEGLETTFAIKVNDVSVVNIRVDGDLTYKTFRYGHELIGFDMAGITVTAIYSDNSELQLSFGDYVVECDFNSVDTTEMTISYDGHSQKITGIVIEDYDVSLKVTFKELGSTDKLTYHMANETNNFSTYFDSVKVVKASGAEADYEGDLSLVWPTADSLKSGVCNLKFRLVDAISKETMLETKDALEVEVWFIVTQGSEWSYIQSHLDGYYMLANDITLSGWSNEIGAAPLISTETIDGEGNGNSENGQVGRAFTGKFDGQRHTISSLKVGAEGYGIDAYFLGMFGWVGAGAEVKNFKLSGAVISGWQRLTFLAVRVDGTIENVTILADSVIQHNSGIDGWTPVYALIGLCGGGSRISNIVCYGKGVRGTASVTIDSRIVEHAWGSMSDIYIGDPFPVEIVSIDTQNIEVEKNKTLDLTLINITVKLSDGSQVQVHPTSLEQELDTTTTGEKTVQFKYSANGKYALKTGTVTVVESIIPMTASLKSGKTGIVIPYNNGWALSNFNDWLDVVDIKLDDVSVADLTGITVQAAALSGEAVKVTFSKQGYSNAEVTMKIQLEVKNHESFMAINSHGSDRFVLTQDVVLEAITNPQYISSNFSGVFDGNFHKLTISIDSTTTNAGLFKGTSSAHFTGTLKNLIVEGSVKSTTYVGGLMVNNEGTIEHCMVLLNVQGNTSDGKVGGLVYSNKGIISDCIFAGTVAGQQVAGLAYYTGSTGTTENCVLVSEQAAVAHFDQPSGTETGLTKISHLIDLSGRYGLSDELYNYLKTITYIPIYVCPYYKVGNNTVVGTWLAVNQVISPSEIYMSITDNNYDPVNQDRIEIISVNCDTSVAKEDVPITIVYTVDGIDFTFTDTVGVTADY